VNRYYTGWPSLPVEAIVAARREGKPALTMNRGKAPLVSGLVDRRCDNVGAPRPRRIDPTWMSTRDLVLVSGQRIFINRLRLLPARNAVIAPLFAHRPAKTTVQVSKPDQGALIEIEVIAGV
jgi:enamine deaminase RidA (YjgF/YER057c/UK114 family)